MLDLTVIAASDYRVGGFSLTQGDPVLQTVANLVHKPSGVFAGVFTSNVDFGTDTRREFDYFLGIARPLSENTRFSLAYVAYDYPKDSWVNFHEWVGTFSYKGATAGFKYTNDLQTRRPWRPSPHSWLRWVSRFRSATTTGSSPGWNTPSRCPTRPC